MFALLLPTVLTANNESQPGKDPAQAITQAPPNDNTPTPPAQKPVASRGQLLYENHCTKCHESLVHIRANRKSKSIDDVRTWVNKWQGEEKLEWSSTDISDVTRYLIEQYYQFK